MKSIKGRLVVIFTAVILTMVTGLGGLFISKITGDITQDAHESLMDMAQQEAQYVQARVNERLTYVSALAQNPILLDESMTFEEKTAFFEAEAQRTGYIAFAFADKNGDATVFNSKRETTNISSRDYFQTALSGHPAVSDLIVSSVTGELVLIFASPVYQQDKVVGVIYGRRDGHALSEIISEVSYKQTGYAYMVNNQGVTVGHRNTDLVLAQDNDIKNMETDESLREIGELTKDMITRTVGSGTYTYNGVKKIVGYAPIADTQWIVAYGLEEAEALADVRTLGKMLWIFVFAAGVFGVVITYIISTRIASPIKKVTVAAQEIAQGKFNVTLSVKSKDEVGQLAEAFNLTLKRLVNYQGYIDEISDALSLMAQGDLRISLNMEYVGQFQKLKSNLEALSTGLSTTLVQIHQASEQVSAGSDQVAAGAQALSQGATEQASSVEELTATIMEISEDLKKSTGSARQARHLSEEARVEVAQSNEQMRQLMTAMEEISKTSHEIGKIIKAIDDIAFQTNILALNAAVEAARAGAAGKGFAVVADEVRNLAAKSAEAAKSTTSLIESTLNAIETGGKLADSTAKYLHNVVEKTQTANEKVEEIASDIEREAMAISQIATGIDQISAVVQTNSATSEESAAASEELFGQAQMLKQLISKFQLSEAYFE
ncbi:methyl-accepting chemotaxis protein [Sedimentibacter sp.]|uniref:methyl-accepting chemotaxis protein n=1 Tax=Sedimentibacter sp. TaxID=1960295 RepID=UPI00289938B3|nr:methyl-accepting chemotaxis protein [Sedimentibacter sp.]